jgi:hypothetical protein
VDPITPLPPLCRVAFHATPSCALCWQASLSSRKCFMCCWLFAVMSSAASVGDTTITVVGVVAWPLGSTIVITATEYDPSQTERVTVTGVTAGDGSTVLSITPPLQFGHVAVTVEGVALAAAVGLLSRSITVTGCVRRRATTPPSLGTASHRA